MRVRGILERGFNAYVDDFIDYAYGVGYQLNLSNSETEGIIKMTVSNQLSQLSKLWKKVTPIQPSFSNVPEGDYIGDLKEIKIEESTKNKRLQAVSVYQIADGDHDGETVKRFDGLTDETNIGYFKGYAEIIGLEIPDDIEMLQEACDEFVANNTDLFNLTVKINDKYANVYVNGISEFVKAGPEETEEAATEETTEETVEETPEETTVEETVVEEEQQEVTPPPRTIKKASAPVRAAVQSAQTAIKKVSAAPPAQTTTKKVVTTTIKKK